MALPRPNSSTPLLPKLHPYQGNLPLHAPLSKICDRARKLPIGSGQVESAVRRVVNLRFKAPGSFWTETTVSGLMHLRAAFKAGRWDEMLMGVMTGTVHMPSFEPVDHAVSQRPAAVPERETSQTFVTPREEAA